MREFNYRLDEALELGFFEVYRLWSIADELRARDLQYMTTVIDNPHVNDERRQEVWDWLTGRQPRRHRKEPIPQEVLDKFAKAFAEAGNG